VPWVLLLPEDHRLNKFQGKVSAEQIGSQDRLLVSNLAVGSQGLEKFLAGVPQSTLMECDGVVALAKAGVGLAIVPDLFGNQPCEGFTKLALAGAEPIQPRLFLPRSGSLPEPLEGLVDAIRRTVEARFAMEPAATATIPLGNGAVEIPMALPIQELEARA
jgi:DNA-binding transcriptional LysR family regulator